MARSMLPFSLPPDEIYQLQLMLSKGKQSVRRLKRAQVLLTLQEGKTPAAVAQLVSVSPAMVYNIRNRYLTEGLTVALSEKPRPGQPGKFDKATHAHLTSLACSQAPDGRSRWTLRLLADRLVELRLVESISYKMVGEQLKKTSLKPWLKQQWCIPKVDGQYVAKMEAVLDFYAQPADPQKPRLCFDERLAPAARLSTAGRYNGSLTDPTGQSSQRRQLVCPKGNSGCLVSLRWHRPPGWILVNAMCRYADNEQREITLNLCNIYACIIIPMLNRYTCFKTI